MNFDRFIRAVHRRHAILRSAESIGLCLLIAFVADLILIPILIYRANSAWPLVLISLAIGTAAGVVVAISRRPSTLDSAIEADRQLDLHDLLGSAYLTRDVGKKDPWAAAVGVMAEDCCGKLSPSSVILNRLGARAWSGIGLSGALVLTLALMTSGPANIIANETKTGVARNFVGEQVDRARSPRTAFENENAVARNVDRDHRDAESESADRSSDRGEVTNEKSATANDPTATNRDLPGSGQATGESKNHRPADQLAERDHAKAKPNGDRVADGTTDGDDKITTANTASKSAAGNSSSDSRDSKLSPAAPWRADDWPARQLEAGDAVKSGQVPHAYRDVVENYFDRTVR